MTQQIFTHIHTRLATERFWQLHRAGIRGSIALQAFAETAQAAEAQYRALPWYYRRRSWWRRN